MFHILLVEDHEDSRVALSRLLELNGHRVSAAGSAAEAVSACDKNPVDLMLIDLILPDGMGTDLLRKLRFTSPAPAIALTGMGEERSEEACLQSGFCACLLKPVPFDELLRSIHAAVAVGRPPAGTVGLQSNSL